MGGRLLNLDKYFEAGTSKRQQRSDLMINGSTGALNMKIPTRMKSVNTNQTVEDQSKNIRVNKRVRTLETEFQPEYQINGIKKQRVSMAKDVNILKNSGKESDLFEKTSGLAGVEEEKFKRKRSIGTILARPVESDEVAKRGLKTRVVDDERDKDYQRNLSQRVGQRSPKVPRTKRSNLGNHVSNQDEFSPSNNTPVVKIAPIGHQKIIIKVDNAHKESGERRLKGKMVNNQEDGVSVQNIGHFVKKNKESVNEGSPNGSKKNGSKQGCRLKRLSECKGLSNDAPLQNSSSPDFTGGSDDDLEELPASANHAPKPSPHKERETHMPRQQSVSFLKKNDLNQKTLNSSATPFYQRILSALIIDDDDDDDISIEINLLQEDYAKSIQIQNSFHASTSDTNYDSDPRKRARVENTDFALRGQSPLLTKKSGCQYEQMCIDDKLLLELQSIGLCPDKLPGLEENEDEMVHHEVDKMNKALHHEADKMNTTVHQQEVEKKECSEKRSIGRCDKLEKAGKSCFNEIPLKDLFSFPIQNKPKESDPKVLSVKNKPTPNRGKNKSLLLNNVNTKRKRSQRKQKTPKGKSVINPTTTNPPIIQSETNNKTDIQHGNDTNTPSPPIEELGPIDDVIGGPHDITSLLEVPEVELEMDVDFAVGLDIPMDDINGLGIF